MPIRHIKIEAGKHWQGVKYSLLFLKQLGLERQPRHGPLQCLHGLGLQDAAGAQTAGQGKAGRKVDVAVAQSQVVPGRGLGAVVDMKVNQPILMGKEKGHVPLPRGLGVADIPGQAEDGALEQVFDSPPLVGEKAVRVLDGDPKGAVADPLLAQGAEAGEGGHIGVEIPIV